MLTISHIRINHTRVGYYLDNWWTFEYWFSNVYSDSQSDEQFRMYSNNCQCFSIILAVNVACSTERPVEWGWKACNWTLVNMHIHFSLKSQKGIKIVSNGESLNYRRTRMEIRWRGFEKLALWINKICVKHLFHFSDIIAVHLFYEHFYSYKQIIFKQFFNFFNLPNMYINRNMDLMFIVLANAVLLGIFK